MTRRPSKRQEQEQSSSLPWRNGRSLVNKCEPGVQNLPDWAPVGHTDLRILAIRSPSKEALGSRVYAAGDAGQDPLRWGVELLTVQLVQELKEKLTRRRKRVHPHLPVGYRLVNEPVLVQDLDVPVHGFPVKPELLR